MNLRRRDVIAIMAALALTRMAWNDSLESLSGNVHLSFYLPNNHAKIEGEGSDLESTLIASPVPFDVDGDGTVEAIANFAPQDDSNQLLNRKSWKLQVYDLKALHYKSRNSITQVTPTLPPLLLESPPINVASTMNTQVKPIQLVSGQVLYLSPASKRYKNIEGFENKKKPDASGSNADTSSSSSSKSEPEWNERNVKYFCGKDWHDAAQRCGTPCPTGTRQECPDGEFCYADTPCDARSMSKLSSSSMKIPEFQLTPGGTAPSLFTLWSNGVLTMHSITGNLPESMKPDASEDSSADSKKKKKKSSGKLPPLELRLMWKVNHLQDMKISESSTAITFLDSVSSIQEKDGFGGMIIVKGGSYATSDEGNDNNSDDNNENNNKDSNFIMAINAQTGNIIWENLPKTSNDDEDSAAIDSSKDEPLLLPMHKNEGQKIKSLARRRSRFGHFALLAAQQQNNSAVVAMTQNTAAATRLPNCMQSYRHSLLNTGSLPYKYYGIGDSSVMPVHFDYHSSSGKAATSRKSIKSKKKHHVSSSADSATTNNNNKRKDNNKRKNDMDIAQFGRPNVLVSHSHGGLQVYSLKNGKPLCHLSLLENTVYGDLNSDGIVDSIQVITDDHKDLIQRKREKSKSDKYDNAIYNGEDVDDDSYEESFDFKDKWVSDLMDGIATNQRDILDDKSSQIGNNNPRYKKKKKYRNKNKKSSGALRMCHALVLSGIPAREEIFASPLCNMGSSSRAARNDEKLSAIAPLIVESTWGNNSPEYKSDDIIFAMNNGMIHRFRGHSGRVVWKKHYIHVVAPAKDGKIHPSYPSWSSDEQDLVVLDRIECPKLVPMVRPLILIGTNSLSLMSARHGNLLASAPTPFPQYSIKRPILVDLNGDGTTDVLIITTDGIWGYITQINTGSSIIFRILVGLLLLGMMLAFLRNRFGGNKGIGRQSEHNKDIRSTDL